MARIQSYVGQDMVKQEAQDLLNRALYAERQKAMGDEPDDETMHLVFEGNPGTGKTSMARDIGKLYFELGLVDRDPTKDGFLELRRKDLVGTVVGETEEKTAEKLAEGLGGVIFIDEAYQLADGGENDYGQVALTEIMAQAENNRDNTVFILGGYNDTLGKLDQLNQGVSSRFPTVLHFKDYDEDERMDIAARQLDKYSVDDDETEDLLYEYIGPPSKGNARDVREKVGKIRRAVRNRVMAETSEEDFEALPPAEKEAVMYRITAADVKAAMGGKDKKLVKVA